MRRGYNLNVFAYEGGVALPFSPQKGHANSVHGCSLEEWNHPLTNVWVSHIMKNADANGGHVDWVNCGLCADERGVNEAVEGVRRGSPADFWKMAEASDGTLVIGTR